MKFFFRKDQREKNVFILITVSAFFIMGLTLSGSEAGAATISIQDTPTITPSAGGFRWSYVVTHTNGVVVGGSDFGTVPPTAGSFFTIYDFAGFIPGSAFQPPGWTFSSALVGVTPATTIVTDDPTAPNLTWLYTDVGNNLTTDLGDSRSLGDFGAESIYGGTAVGAYASRDRNRTLSRFSRSSGNVEVPSPIPSAMLLLGTGLIGLIALGRKKSFKR